MGMTISEKILARASGKKEVRAREIIWAEPDVAMMHDMLGPVLLGKDMEELGGKIKYPERVVVVSDHFAPAASIEQATVIKTNRDWARDKGIKNYMENQGACHQLLVDYSFSRPGRLVVGTDSHTCTAGALGAFGTGIGSTEMLGVILTGEIWLRVPDSVLVKWEGSLPEGVMAKDAILHTTGYIGHAGATYQALEFAGSMIDELPLDERMVFTNMAVEMGAKTGIMAADEKVVTFFAQRGIEVEPLASDADAAYLRVLNFVAAELSPQVAMPHHVDNVFSVGEVEGLEINQAYIGSCTGGRLTDLAAAARVLKGRKVSSDVRCLIVPASQQVWLDANKAGILGTLAEAGCVISAPTCGACAGLTTGVLAAGERCISTTNRNFVGRMGSKESEVCLASPLTVAAAALTGRISDPRKVL